MCRLWKCFYRIFKRTITNFGTVYFSSAKGCYEGMPSWEFLTYVWDFNRKYRPVLEAALEKQKKNIKRFFIIKKSEATE